MSCPNIAVLEQDITFSAQFLDAAGTPADLDSLPTYKIYEEVTNTEIATGTMAKQDDANTEGYYIEKIATTTGIGYETLKTYTIRVEGVASAIEVATVFSFIVLGQSDLTVASGDLLTTVARFKLYCGITSSDDDTLIGQLITRSTNAIQRYCNRDFVSTTYREFRDGDGGNEINLRQFPVISITMFGIGREDAFSIQNTSSDAYNAQVSISDSTISLQVQGGTNDGTETLTLSNYATLTALFVAIAALDKGWTVQENSTLSIWSPIELLPTGKGLQCLNNFANPQIPEEPEEDFTVDNTAGILKFFGRFWGGFQNIIIRYTAGYAEIPADLEQICIDLTKTYYNQRNINDALESEKMGDYSYKTRPDMATNSSNVIGLPSTIAGRLSKWSTMA